MMGLMREYANKKGETPTNVWEKDMFRLCILFYAHNILVSVRKMYFEKMPSYNMNVFPSLRIPLFVVFFFFLCFAYCTYKLLRLSPNACIFTVLHYRLFFNEFMILIPNRYGIYALIYSIILVAVALFNK